MDHKEQLELAYVNFCVKYGPDSFTYERFARFLTDEYQEYVSNLLYPVVKEHLYHLDYQAPNFSKVLVVSLQDALRRGYSQWDFYAFCDVLGLRKRSDDAHSLQMWKRFQDLVTGVTSFDQDTLTKLLNACPQAE